MEMLRVIKGDYTIDHLTSTSWVVWDVIIPVTARWTIVPYTLRGASLQQRLAPPQDGIVSGSEFDGLRHDALEYHRNDSRGGVTSLRIEHPILSIS